MFQLPGEGKDQDDRKHGQADDDMACMQADEGIERGAEEIGADSQAVLVNQLLPFEAGTNKKNRSQSHGERPPQTERSPGVPLQGTFRYPDRETAGKQANGIEDGKLQHLARIGPSEALADVIDIGN